MQCTFLGQAGLLLKTGGVSIMIDPYLSDSVAQSNPRNRRRQPIDRRYLAMQPDVLILTHSHQDHADPETLRHLLLPASRICVLSSRNAWQLARQFGGESNYVSFNAGARWTEKGVAFEAIPAAHSDDAAIGVVIRAEGKTVVHTGDTLDHQSVRAALPKGADALFLPINGVGNNMNMYDAANLARCVQAKQAVPLHYGMFDSLDPRAFPCPQKRILSIYQEEAL